MTALPEQTEFTHMLATLTCNFLAACCPLCSSELSYRVFLSHWQSLLPSATVEQRSLSGAQVSGWLKISSCGADRFSWTTAHVQEPAAQAHVCLLRVRGLSVHARGEAWSLPGEKLMKGETHEPLHRGGRGAGPCNRSSALCKFLFCFVSGL